MRGLLPRVGQLGVLDCDTVLVAAGINDCLRLTPPRQFETDVRTLVAMIRQRTNHPAPIMLIEIPPARMLWDFPRIPATIAARHAITLNKRIRIICAESSLTSFVPFAPSGAVDEPGIRQWRGSMYKEWAAQFVIAVAGSLCTAREDMSEASEPEQSEPD